MSKKKNKTTKPIQPPFKAHSYYEKALMAYVDDMEKKVFKKYKNIADTTTEEGILALILSFTESLPLFGKIALKFVNLLNGVHKKKFNTNLETIGFKEIVDADLEALLRLKREANVALIKTIPQELHDKLKIKLKDFLENPNGKSLIKIIEKEFNVSRSKAKRIARDQTAKINHDLSAARSIANGSTHYIWRTSEDERVSDEHKKLNKKKFSWKNGSSCCGHPSSRVNCRCLALGVY